jgi:hypothetical protein
VRAPCSVIMAPRRGAGNREEEEEEEDGDADADADDGCSTNEGTYSMSRSPKNCELSLGSSEGNMSTPIITTPLFTLSCNSENEGEGEEEEEDDEGRDGALSMI